jgi:ribosomal protein S18 acetylase RimI-like enzyme
MPGPSLRDGKASDLADIRAIEEGSFSGDRLSPRSIRRLLAAPSASLRVAALDGHVAGYHLVLTRKGSSVARLYSIAVAATARGRGLGERLLADAERMARRRGAVALRLEVRTDNAGAIRLYTRRGYRRIGTYPAYYADGADALRFEKPLGNAAPGSDAAEDRSRGKFVVSTRPMKRMAAGLRPDREMAAPIGGGEA